LDYSYLSNTATASKWQKIGINRRSGIAVPLFSIYSKDSIGIGEITDLKLLVDWCKKTGMSIIQLLPLNEIGMDRAPYSSISTFAIEPIYINLNKVIGVDLNLFKDDIIKLKKRFPQRKLRARYSVKHAKLDLLLKFYQNAVSNESFNKFCSENAFWLDDYALLKVTGEKLSSEIWYEWSEDLKNRKEESIKEIEIEYHERIKFYKWVQWQLYEQLKDVKQYANDNGVLLMGDLPFLVSRDSADVWSHQNYFRLELSSGAPPDMYFALGQKWGMPPYNWYEIAKDEFAYIRKKLKYAENFYNMYRIDHFVGLFRVWTIPINSPPEEAASHGRYEPPEEHLWEEHGKAIINAMLESTSMLPCAEDLGTVPPCSYRVLYDYGITGIDFQRYLKNQGNNFAFKNPHEYRLNSVAVSSTHDSSFFFNWWKHEAGTMDEKLFELLCMKQGLDVNQIKEIKKVLFKKKLSGYGRLYWNDEINSRDLFLSIMQPSPETEHNLSYAYLDSYAEKWKFLDYLEYFNTTITESGTELIYKCLEKINQSASIFSIQLLQEYLALDDALFEKMNKWRFRINTPGTVNNNNWSLLLPCPLEDMLGLEINNTIKDLMVKTGRI
jgi:4-alpha-glucanotransferase